VVVGLGRSGLAAARLAASRGARVAVTDLQPSTALGDLPGRAREVGAQLYLGSHPLNLVDEADLLVVSPGVPPGIELLQEARRRGIPIWGEVELAARFCHGRMIGITGSNGKSTVTSMIGHVLRGAGIPGGTGGNLDTPLADLLVLDAEEAVHAVELSSFQLESVEALQPDVAVIVNLSPDHLDRHPSYDDYARAKARLLDVQSESGFSILNADDPESERFHDHVRGKLHLFSTRRAVTLGACMDAGRLTLRGAGGQTELLAAADLPLPGEHNVSNALAAALACHLVGCPAGEIGRGLSTFRALPHRLERVRVRNGVTFYNDSKATNPASTARALSAFEPGRVYLIVGGKEKGADWSELVRLLPRYAKRVLLVGNTMDELRGRLEGTVPLIECGTVASAVESAAGDAAHGDVVLLSPACASFDQYRNFEERGDDFRRAVARLSGGGEEDA
jgi:UDP-N-acetylmuramoylalanine--D-glutamate ligase